MPTKRKRERRKDSTAPRTTEIRVVSPKTKESLGTATSVDDLLLDEARVELILAQRRLAHGAATPQEVADAEKHVLRMVKRAQGLAPPKELG